MIQAAILGASGYTGAELVRILAGHPGFEVSVVSGDSKSGLSFGEVYPSLKHLNLPKLCSVEDINFGNLDVVFCALPHTKSAHIIRDLPKHIKVIDLSADFRLADVNKYEEWYGIKHPAPDLQIQAVYGLTEFYRSEIKNSRIVAGTGCNAATGMYPLIPLLKENLIDPEEIIINLATGVSGAGRKVKEEFIFCEVSEGYTPYNVSRHRHLAEFDQEFSKAAGRPVRVTFTPHLLPQNRGILATIYVKGNLQHIQKSLEKRYMGEEFINVMSPNTLISTRHVKGSNFCHIGVCESSKKDVVVIFSSLDNLIKGSSGQAIQNANLLFGLEENSGLLTSPLFP
ncbi:MAG: N-acetyl-gamma-glutamyl-phosphate reductase [Paracoccaceae bacterium]|nr:N-acetyl-gamma-glutamyl-phosphate reductase [Paracoccaceae bacterium]